MNTDYLLDLRKNNNREWFNYHKERYLQEKAEFDSFVQRLIDGIYLFDQTIGLQEVKDCTYRIYKDMRFSRDGEPYKTWFGAFICPGGKKTGKSGYYFHIEPEEESDYIGGCMLAAGHYRLEPKELAKFREAIIEDPKAFDNAVKKGAKAGFTLGEADLKRIPNGFEGALPPEYSHYLLYKRFCLSKMFSLNDFSSNEELLARTLEEFKTCKDFLQIHHKIV